MCHPVHICACTVCPSFSSTVYVGFIGAASSMTEASKQAGHYNSCVLSVHMKEGEKLGPSCFSPSFLPHT